MRRGPFADRIKQRRYELAVKIMHKRARYGIGKRLEDLLDRAAGGRLNTTSVGWLRQGESGVATYYIHKRKRQAR